MKRPPTAPQAMRIVAQLRGWSAALATWVLSVHLANAAVTTTGNVSPDPTTTTSTTTFYVGQTTNGTLLVDGGSVVTSGTSYVGYEPNVVGSATLTGASTTWLYSSLRVGREGGGELEILDGATASGSSATIADREGSSGNALVSGTGSQWTSTLFTVGDAGTGELNIENGGAVTSTIAEIGGFGGTGFATVSGPGSILTATSSLQVGSFGPGTLTVESGGKVISATANIAEDDAYAATFTITGPGSIWTNAGDAGVGYRGAGTLNISDDAQATVGGDTFVGRQASGAGTIIFDETTLDTGGLLTRVSDLHGTGTINTHGLVTDLSLVFDATHGLQQQYIITDGGTQNITINLDANGAGAMGAGYRAISSLTVADGRKLLARDGYLGFHSGSTGTAIVDGAGTAWKMSRNLVVGSSGSGSISIQNGAAVEVGGSTTLGSSSTTGVITFNNGTLTTTSLLGGVNQLLGSGTVSTRGLVSDVDLTFDSTHPLQQQFVFNSLPNQNVVLNLNVDGTGALGAGYTGQGSLTIAEGRQISSTLGYLGYRSGSTGSATVMGAGTRWLIGGQLLVGNSGTGNLMISDGAIVSAGSLRIARGQALVTGAGSTSTITGGVSVGAFFNGGVAELRITAGGKVLSGGSIPGSFLASGVGADFGTTGSATIDGPGSNWTHAGTFTVGGDGGTGSLTITGGGTLNSSGGVISSGGSGFGAGTSSVVVTGPGSSWLNTGALSVGASRAATLTISNGGTVTSTGGGLATSFNVGNDSSSITVKDAGSSWVMSGGLNIGYFSGPGAPLVIQSGGVVQASDVSISSTGRLNLQGGTLTASTIRFTSFGGQFNWTGGTLHVGTFFGSLTNAAGVLAPGRSAGRTSVNGNYIQQSGGALEIEIGGTTATTQYDNVSVSGATLGGILQLSLINAFVPSPANTFIVLASTGTLTGAFSNGASGQRLPTNDGLGTFLVSYGTGSPFNSKQVVLSAFTITGDFNADGRVDAADYAVWRRTVGSTVVKYTSADADGSGMIDSADYDHWRANYGRAATAGSGGSSVIPECSAIALLAVYCTLVGGSHRVRRRTAAHAIRR